MGIFSKLFGSKNPLESMKLDDLRVMEIKLTKKIEELSAEINQVDREINLLFEKAKEAKSKSEELSLARRIKTLSQKKEMKLAAQAQIEKELRAVTNVLILKEHEADLKSAGVWDAIKKLEPEKLESWLISKNLEARNRSELVATVLDMTSKAMVTGAEYEEDLEDILDAIRAVKEGDLEPEEAREKVEKFRVEEE